jgi:phosphoglycerate dehydrogenase-like enzyme
LDPDLGKVHGQGDLLTLLPHADYVVVAAPLTEQTRGMFNTAAFERMKPSARLINVGRGPIVAEDDLAKALHNKDIAGCRIGYVHPRAIACGTSALGHSQTS